LGELALAEVVHVVLLLLGVEPSTVASKHLALGKVTEIYAVFGAWTVPFA
jgi:hypothetical protein